MVIMSTLMSVTVFMNFSKSRSDMSRAVGVSAEAGAGEGAVAEAGLEMGRGWRCGCCWSFVNMFRSLLFFLQIWISVVLLQFWSVVLLAGFVSCSFGSC